MKAKLTVVNERTNSHQLSEISQKKRQNLIKANMTGSTVIALTYWWNEPPSGLPLGLQKDGEVIPVFPLTP